MASYDAVAETEAMQLTDTRDEDHGASDIGSVDYCNHNCWRCSTGGCSHG